MSLESQAYELAAKLIELEEAAKQVNSLGFRFLKDLLGTKDDSHFHRFPEYKKDPELLVDLHYLLWGETLDYLFDRERDTNTPGQIAQALLQFAPDAEAFKAKRLQKDADEAEAKVS